MVKNNELSILRAIGAMSVILIHVTSTFAKFDKTTFSYLFLGSINKSCNFAVPLFLFLSVLLLTKNSFEKEKLNTLEFYKKRFLKTVPIYLIYILIYYIYLSLNNRSLISITEDPVNFFINYVLQGSLYAHLYFMPIIFQLYILFPLIFLLIKKLKQIKINTTFSFILTFGVLILFQFLFQIIHKYYIWPYFQHPAVIVFTYILPIGMGIWTGINYNKFHELKFIKTLSIIIALISGYIYVHYTIYPTITIHNLVLPIYTASACIVLLCIASFINNKLNLLSRFMYKISEHSLTIYLVHPLILDIFRKYFTQFDLFNNYFLNNIFYLLVSFVAILSGAYLVSLILSVLKNRIFKY